MFRTFQIAGYPQAAAGVTQWVLYHLWLCCLRIAYSRQSTSGTLKTESITPSDFTDNANGTASLKTSFPQPRQNHAYWVHTLWSCWLCMDGKVVSILELHPIYWSIQFCAHKALLPNASRIDDIHNGRPYKPFSFCEDNTIAFINTSSFLIAFIGTYTAQFRPDWSLGDPLDGRSIYRTNVLILFILSTKPRSIRC